MGAGTLRIGAEAQRSSGSWPLRGSGALPLRQVLQVGRAQQFWPGRLTNFLKTGTGHLDCGVQTNGCCSRQA